MKNNRGFIGKAILIVVALLLLKYVFNFDIIEFFKSPDFQKVIEPVVSLAKNFYNWLDIFIKNLVAK